MQDGLENFVETVDLNTIEESSVKFKHLFMGSELGLDVLSEILERCKFMEPCDNERDMALNNFAKELLTTIFWDTEKHHTNIHRIIDFVKNKLKRRKCYHGRH